MVTESEDTDFAHNSLCIAHCAQQHAHNQQHVQLGTSLYMHFIQQPTMAWPLAPQCWIESKVQFKQLDWTFTALTNMCTCARVLIELAQYIGCTRVHIQYGDLSVVHITINGWCAWLLSCHAWMHIDNHWLRDPNKAVHYVLACLYSVTNKFMSIEKRTIILHFAVIVSLHKESRYIQYELSTIRCTRIHIQ